MSIEIPLFLLFLAWVVLEGIKDAYLFHGLSIATPAKKVPHYIFTAHRWVFFALIAHISHDWMFVLSLSLLFPILHNSVYYEGRNMLNKGVYLKGWMDDSTTSTALINFKFKQRVAMGIAGIAIFASSILV